MYRDRTRDRVTAAASRRKTKRDGVGSYKDTKTNRTSSSGRTKSSSSVHTRTRVRTGRSGSGTSSTSKATRGLNRRLANMGLNEEGKSQGGRISKRSEDKRKEEIQYTANSIIGKGSFGTVYKATINSTGETVAIKKVLQDRRFKNRELQVMRMMSHPNVVVLKHSFYAKEKEDVYLNLVMEYVPVTVHHHLKSFTKLKKSIPVFLIRLYMYQISRALAYIHSLGICHRDIKPHNLLLNPKTHVCKLIDFGSAKILVAGQPNVAYICSRYYRAPELVFEATEYTTKIDVWSMGCVMAELFLGTPIFMGLTREQQLIEIVRILGTPSRTQIKQMSPGHKGAYKFARIKPMLWPTVFRGKAPEDALDLIAQILKYEPNKRISAFRALAHPFFNDLRKADARLPNGKPMPPLFNFTESEIKQATALNLVDKLVQSKPRQI
mmetsp:Transcript_6927/g.12745  ORF Transcript_6927/g.12745 Transcript_6927/m.12745 type:complete len:437 (+) Transcript_6927:178-1488(+)